MNVYIYVCLCVFEHKGEHLNNFWTEARVHMKLIRHLINIMINQSLVDVKGRKWSFTHEMTSSSNYSF